MLLGMDLGQGMCKARTDAGIEIAFPHALVSLEEADYRRFCERGTGHGVSEVLRVNDRPYAFGETAEGIGSVAKRMGADRYGPEYYGVLMAIALVHAIGDTDTEAGIMASFPPRDSMYRDDILALYDQPGTFRVEMMGTLHTYHLTGINAIDEPLGGWANVVFSDDGGQYADADLLKGRTLVVDIGFGTSDFCAVGVGGKPDYSVRDSITSGMSKVLARFHDLVRTRYRDAFRSGHDILPEFLREGLQTGRMPCAGQSLDVEAQAVEASAPFLRDLRDAYHYIAGGPANWETVLQTGGGPAALGERLVAVWEHYRVQNADPDLTHIHMANCRGLLKLARLYRRQGWM